MATFYTNITKMEEGDRENKNENTKENTCHLGRHIGKVISLWSGIKDV